MPGRRFSSSWCPELRMSAIRWVRLQGCLPRTAGTISWPGRLGIGVSWGQRMVSLVLAATLIAGLMILALAPAAPAAIAASVPVTAYVTTLGNNGVGESVTPIDVATNTAGSSIPFNNRPRGIAFSPNGGTVYVTNSGGNTITPINTATNIPGTPITVGLAPGGIVVTPDGTTAYVVLNTASVVSVNLATGTTGTPINIPRLCHVRGMTVFRRFRRLM
jgi:YVTN family beta-propeller protein